MVRTRCSQMELKKATTEVPPYSEQQEKCSVELKLEIMVE